MKDKSPGNTGSSLPVHLWVCGWGTDWGMNTVHFAVTASRRKAFGDNRAPVKIKILFTDPKQDVAHLWQQRVKDFYFYFFFKFIAALTKPDMCFGFGYSWPSPDCHTNNSLQYNRLRSAQLYSSCDKCGQKHWRGFWSRQGSILMRPWTGMHRSHPDCLA